MPQEGPLSGLRILIAEDNAIQAYDLSCLLRSAGAEVIGPVKTVADALALAQSAFLTCAVLEVILRGETIFAAARALKERGISIIWVTGSSDLEVLKRDWPEAQIISKPASTEFLLQSICETRCCGSSAGSIASA
jgi:CheY-like chemotaxis protein